MKNDWWKNNDKDDDFDQWSLLCISSQSLGFLGFKKQKYSFDIKKIVIFLSERWKEKKILTGFFPFFCVIKEIW